MEECLEWSICSCRMEVDIYILYIDGGVSGVEYMYLTFWRMEADIYIFFVQMEECLEWSICSWRMEADKYIFSI